MNSTTRVSRTLLASALSLALLAGCSSTPSRMAGLDQAEHRLAQLQTDPELYNRAPLAIQQAEQALRAAEAAPRKDTKLGAHLLFMAERKIEIAWALAEARLLEDQREGLQREQSHARVRASERETERAYRESDRAHAAAARSADQLSMADQRTQSARDDAMAARYEADAARDQLVDAQMDKATARERSEAAMRDSEMARMQRESALRDSEEARSQRAAALRASEDARVDADLARSQASVARDDAAAARAEAAASQQRSIELQASIDALKARPTDRGWVVTLGDVLFATGRAEINEGAGDHLNQLAGFLMRHPQRTAMIEGHTDNVGSAASNQGLSERRAESVRAFLISRGVEPTRLRASGLGQGVPIASNGSSTGRQQNRRVEVIISNFDEGDTVSATN